VVRLIEFDQDRRGKLPSVAFSAVVLTSRFILALTGLSNVLLYLITRPSLLLLTQRPLANGDGNNGPHELQPIRDAGHHIEPERNLVRDSAEGEGNREDYIGPGWREERYGD
jgi:hypothetical protein